MGIFRTAVIATALLAAPTLALGQAPEPAPAVPTADRDAEVDALFSAYATLETPGCAVSAARDGQLLVERGYGSANLEYDIPITPVTVFEAGSVSKQFTAAAILLLAQEGRLKLGDDIRKYLPKMPDYGRPITIEQLLTHTSGLRDWGDLAGFMGWPRTTRAYSQDDILEIIRRQRSLNYEPGAEYSYTNSGYNLLTEIVRKASGQSLADYSRTKIFAPLGMTRTAWRDDFHRIVRGRAAAYQRIGAGYQELMPFEDGYGNGGLLTTVGDLQTWNQALASNTLGDLGAQLERRGVLSNGARIAYGRGVLVQAWQGLEEVGHSGATAGYRAWLARYPAEKLSVAVLCNASDANTVPLGRAVAALFLRPPPPPTETVPLRNPAALAGMYVNEKTGRPLVLVAGASGLSVSGAGPLYPLTADSVRFGGDVIAFQEPGVFVLRTLEGGRYIHRRTPHWAPTTEQLLDFPGRYHSDELDVTYRVTLDAGQLSLKLENRTLPAIAMGAMYQDAFNLSGNLARFRRDKAGKVTHLRLGSARVRDLVLRRIG
ncbi:MAG: class A beta-lactamase-related serine hydrolase [Caulobacteraceae bacterium]|nr:MAG: class A beta-lactamase-related serine hydrolase [Caulobacteraceae bacterium]